MQIPFFDLKAQYASIRSEIREALDKLYDRQQFILGPDVEQLEQAVARYSNAKYAVGVSSGTDALLTALVAIDIKPGDEVITSPYSFFSSASVIARLGAKPVFADVDSDSFNIDPQAIAKRISSRTKALIPVHLFGQCADMAPILKIAANYGIPVIEDAAQAIGAEYDGKRAGSMGLMGCFSFYPSKNLGGFGDGGMLVTDDAELAEKLRCLRVHGGKREYYHEMIGGNFRLDAIQAAILNIKLKYLDAWTRKRQENASFYDRALSLVSGVSTPLACWQHLGDRHYHVYNQYVIRVSARDRLQDFLKRAGVGTKVYYPCSLHLQPCFAYLGYSPLDFFHSEAASRESLALPIYPELRTDQLEYVVGKVSEFFEGKGRDANSDHTATESTHKR
jgi:dTDP-4-amino-4,6-dideoxygalactose transaminase